MVRNLLRHQRMAGLGALLILVILLPVNSSARQTPEVSTAESPVVLVETTALTSSSELTLLLAEGTSDSVLRVDLMVTNTSPNPANIDFISPTIEVYDRASRVWPLVQLEWIYSSPLIDPGKSFTLELTASNSNVLAYNGPVFVRISNVLDADITTFGVTYENGLALVPDTVPKSPLNHMQRPVAANDADTIVLGSTVTVPGIDALMPTLDELPPGLWIVEQNKLDQAAIASTFTDPAMADRFLNDWGWMENTHIYLEGAPTADGISYVDVGIHRFSSETSALQAMDYYLKGRAEVLDEWEVDDFAYGIYGRTITNGVDTTAYAVVDNVVIRVSVAGADSARFASDIRHNILVKAHSQSMTTANATRAYVSGTIALRS